MYVQYNGDTSHNTATHAEPEEVMYEQNTYIPPEKLVLNIADV